MKANLRRLSRPRGISGSTWARLLLGGFDRDAAMKRKRKKGVNREQ